MISSSNHSTSPETTAVDPTDDPPPPPLLPGLPNHLAQTCLSAVRPSLLSAVCRHWRRLIYTPHFPPFLSLYAIVAINNATVGFFNFDPISSKWTTLPPPPPADPPLRFLHRHPSFISRNLTIQSLTVSDRLVLIAATGHDFLPALSHPLVFDPLAGEWFLGPPFSNPRRWCAAGSVGGVVYVASGVGAHYRSDVGRKVEKWDVKDGQRWEETAAMNDGRFSREAVEAVGYKGKLCMVNVKGNAGKEGVVYDVEGDRWEKMAAGMLSRWKGPVGVAEEEVMYVVDEEKGAVRKYDDENDRWEEVVGGSEVLKGAEQMAVGGGKICVVSGGGRRITVVDVVAEPVKMWTVDPPVPENEVISVHILSRLTKSL